MDSILNNNFNNPVWILLVVPELKSFNYLYNPEYWVRCGVVKCLQSHNESKKEKPKAAVMYVADLGPVTYQHCRGLLFCTAVRIHIDQRLWTIISLSNDEKSQCIWSPSVQRSQSKRCCPVTPSLHIHSCIKKHNKLFETANMNLNANSLRVIHTDSDHVHCLLHGISK